MSTIQDLRLLGIGFNRSSASRPRQVDTAELDYFESRIGRIGTADELLADARLYRFVMQAFGVEHFSQSRDIVRRALSEGLDDPKSTANRLGDAKLKEMVAALGLDEPGAPKLDRWDTVSDVSRRWAARDPALQQTLGQRDIDYFKANIGTARSTDDLMKNDRLYVFVMKAFGLEHAIGERDLMRRVLDEGVLSDFALANRLGDPRYKEVAEFLGFKENEGANLRRDGYVGAIVERYVARYPELKRTDGSLYGPLYERRADIFRKQAVNAREIAYFTQAASRIRTPDDLFADDRLYRFVLNAFGLGDKANAKALMRKIVTEGVADPRSAANRMSDPRFKEMVAALGFETVPANLGDPDVMGAVTARYVARHPTASILGSDRYSTELKYYRSKVKEVRTPDDLLGDVRLYNFVVDAFGLDGSRADRTFLRKVLTEGVPATPGPLDDPRLSDPAVRELAGAFRFEAHRSSLGRPGVAQDFVSRFTAQGIEVEQGERNTGVRLALTFLRRVPEIAHREGSEKGRIMALLADRALSEVAFTALGLPSQMAGMDIDRLAGQLSRRIDMDDLRDPARLLKFVERFAVMYDLKNQEQGGAGVLPLVQPLSLDQRGRPSSPQIFGIDPSVTMALLRFPRF